MVSVDCCILLILLSLIVRFHIFREFLSLFYFLVSIFSDFSIVFNTVLTLYAACLFSVVYFPVIFHILSIYCFSSDHEQRRISYLLPFQYYHFGLAFQNNLPSIHHSLTIKKNGEPNHLNQIGTLLTKKYILGLSKITKIQKNP